MSPWHFSALWRLLGSLPAEQRRHVASLAIDGTSATTLLIDGATGACLAPPKMYNDAQGADAVARAKQIAPADHTATAATSTLCKVLAWDGEGAWQKAVAAGLEPAIVHQAGGGGCLLVCRQGCRSLLQVPAACPVRPQAALLCPPNARLPPRPCRRLGGGAAARAVARDRLQQRAEAGV